MASLIRLFCEGTREFFGVSGTYFWELTSSNELTGTEAAGLMVERFRGERLSLSTTHGSMAVECVRGRKTLYLNNLDTSRYPMAAQYNTRSIMAAPLIVFGEPIGAAVFLHDSDPAYFNEDMAAKATILAGQIGSLLEATRVTESSRERQRSAIVLAEAAHDLRTVTEEASVIQALADRVRTLLRTSSVAVLLRQGETFQLRAVSTEGAKLKAAARTSLQELALRFAGEVAKRAVLGSEVLTAGLEDVVAGLEDLAPPGTLLIAPFRSSRGEGVILAFPRRDRDYSAEDHSLISAIAAFGGVAIANSELYATASGQAQELQQLLEISSELSSVANLDQFMREFVQKAASFLGFHHAIVALLEQGSFQVRWAALSGKVRPFDLQFPPGPANSALLKKEAFWTDDVTSVPWADSESLPKLKVNQLLCVPLTGSDGGVLGMFAVLDRKDGVNISHEDLRRAKALGAEVAVALEITRSLHASEQHRRRAESLVNLALETTSLLRLPDFARNFLSRAASVLNAGAAALLLQQESKLETIALQGSSADDAALRRRLNTSVNDVLSRKSQSFISGKASDLIGPSLANALGWQDVILARLTSTGGEMVGVLCLANRTESTAPEDHQLLQAVASHASIALENARLFTRMDQANRHWIEIFDAISDFIVVHDEQHKVLRVNQALADFIGVRPQELIGVGMSAVLAMATDTAPRSCPFCRGGTTGLDEFVQPVLERTYLVSTSRIHASESESLQTIHVLKDISDRREAERRYRELFDNIQEGLFFTTPDGRFIEVNDALVRMLGYDSREELLQAEVPAQIYFSPQRRLELVRLMEEHGSLRNYHETLRRKDGSLIHVLMNAFAVRDAQGQVTQFRGLMLDITDLKNFQSELQRERDFSSKILNNTQSLILVADTAGLISYANRRWYEAGGYEHHQLVGHPLSELIAPSRRDALQEALSSTISGHQIDNLELPVLRADGRTGQFSVNLSPMRDDQSHVSSIVVVMTDVTDAAMLQAKLMHTEKMAAVGQLVSGVAHEVNNPLTAILGFADLMMENPELTESARKDLRVILQEAQRTKQIVQNLLSFARQVPPQRQAVQVNAILDRTLQLRAYDFSSHGVEVVEHFHGNLPEVIGDSHQLQQVFLNILNNAYDAVRETGRPPRIEIVTSSVGGFAEVSFRDNGIGITHPDKIFDPFFTTKEVGKGTGLGLSICYGILREHGGEIFCHNNENGPGATFVVRLPAASEPAVLSASAASLQR